MNLFIKIKKYKILIIILIFIFFLFSNFIDNINFFFQKKNNKISFLNKKKFYLKNYKLFLEKKILNYYLKYNRKPKKLIKIFLIQKTWKEIIEQEIYNQEYFYINILITNYEIIDLIKRNNIDFNIIKIFKKKKIFFKNKIEIYFKYLFKNFIKKRNNWINFKKKLSRLRIKNKINNIIKKSFFINNLELKREYLLNKNYINIKYNYISYCELINPKIYFNNSSLLNKYFNKNFYEINNIDFIKYIKFLIKSHKNDIIKFEVNLYKTILKFRYFNFFKINKENNLFFLNLKKKELPFYIKNNLYRLKNKSIIGPLISNKIYKIYKLYNINNEYLILSINKKIKLSNKTINNIFNKIIFLKKKKNLNFFMNSKSKKLKIYFKKINFQNRKIGKFKEIDIIINWLHTHKKKPSPLFKLKNFYFFTILTKNCKNNTKKKKILKILNDIKSLYIFKKNIKMFKINTKCCKYLKYHDHAIFKCGFSKKIISKSFFLEKKLKNFFIKDKNGIFIFSLINKFHDINFNNYNTYKSNKKNKERLKQNFLIFEIIDIFSKILDIKYKYKL